MPIKRHYEEASLFTPQNLLREARRQKSIRKRPVPAVCVLDPDGDIVEYLQKTSLASLNPYWACYHTRLYDFKLGSHRVGIVGSAVGSSYAVLVAEELFASGCRLLLSITSAGRICHPEQATRYLLIEKALRDEGTSYHYLPATQYSYINKSLLKQLQSSLKAPPIPLLRGCSWTTDAPFRETQSAISQAKSRKIDCVEMEAAALYAFAQAKKQRVVCIAHVTNSMAQSGNDFEKGAEMGSLSSLKLIEFIIRTLRV